MVETLPSVALGAAAAVLCACLLLWRAQVLQHMLPDVVVLDVDRRLQRRAERLRSAALGLLPLVALALLTGALAPADKVNETVQVRRAEPASAIQAPAPVVAVAQPAPQDALPPSYFVRAGGRPLLLRSAPGGAVLATLEEGAIVTATGEAPREHRGLNWVAVNAATGVRGWVARKYLVDKLEFAAQKASTALR